MTRFSPYALRFVAIFGLGVLLCSCGGPSRNGAILPPSQPDGVRQATSAASQIVVTGLKTTAGRNNYFRLSLGPDHAQLSRSRLTDDSTSVGVHGTRAYVGGFNEIEVRDVHGTQSEGALYGAGPEPYTVDAIAVTPDGTVYASADKFAVDGCPTPMSYCGADIAAYPPSSQNPSVTFGWRTLGGIHSLASDASGRLYASWSDFSNVNHISQILRGEPIDYPTDTSHDTSAPNIAALPDGTLLIARSAHRGRPGSIEVYSTAKNRVLRRFGIVEHQGTLSVSADGTQVFEADIQSGGAITQYAYPAGSVTAKFGNFWRINAIAAAP